jgi:hypothetical protein
LFGTTDYNITMPTSIEEWLTSIDVALLKYATDFRRLDIVDKHAVQFMRSRDFEKFNVPVSSVHRRMLVYEIEKLQSPKSQRVIELDKTPEARGQPG